MYKYDQPTTHSEKKKKPRKNQDVLKMILFIAELFANVKRFSFYIKPSSGNLYMWYI